MNKKSSVIINLVEKSIRLLKSDSNYKLDKQYSISELYFIIYYRFMQALRGCAKKIKIKKSRGIIFCGKNVKIQFGFLITAGKSLILEENVILNALSHTGIILGDNVTIAKNSVLQCTGVIARKGIGIKIGNNSAVGAQSYLGGQGGIEIGNDVIMGPNVNIFSENHNYSNSEVIIRKQGETRKSVKINDNCWIGAGSIILGGAEIGEGCVIAAGSVVTKSFPSNSIIGGVPAKIIKSRL
jgi:acetyltransferase-like isoleucine patch superfamily enzyme